LLKVVIILLEHTTHRGEVRKFSFSFLKKTDESIF